MGMLEDLIYARDAVVGRCSSYDREGRNEDYYKIPPGETAVLAEIEGPGRITHIWMTQSNDDRDFYRKCVLRMYWDGEAEPSVLVPLGDFFCLGHSMVASFQSLPFTASVNPGAEYTFGGPAALNCYFQMPFRRSARIELVNESEAVHTQYFYIDYERYAEPFPDSARYFHAAFRRENPTCGWGEEITVNYGESNAANLSPKSNYVLLDAVGNGHLAGFNLSVTNLQKGTYWKPGQKNWHEATWWGEGDEMIFVDGMQWPPALHGTGSEDAFNQAYGMQDRSYLFNGTTLFEQRTHGYQCSYVFYAANPVRFRKSIHASIEHGHANHLSNEYASVAYWYQDEPHKPFSILPAAQRLPLVRSFLTREGGHTTPEEPEWTEEMVAMKQRWKEAYER